MKENENNTLGEMTQPEPKAAIVARLEELLAEVEAMPDHTGGLFDTTGEYKTPCRGFFFDVLNRYKERPAVLEHFLDLEGDAVEVYRRLNAPKHPIRNRLIAWTIDRAEERRRSPRAG